MSWYNDRVLCVGFLMAMSGPRLKEPYHDTATDDPNDYDMNVYLRRLTKSGGKWSATARIQVNKDVTQNESDQFMPALTVDSASRIQVTFYDDRRFTDPDPNDPNEDQQPDTVGSPKFDVFYAWAPHYDLSFEDEDRNIKLFLDPNNPSDPNEPAALDFALESVNPREYIGITWHGDHVWTTYPGTWEDDPAPNQGVIWSSRIDW